MFYLISLPHPKWKENGDWSAGDKCIPSAKYHEVVITVRSSAVLFTLSHFFSFPVLLFLQDVISY